MESIKRVGYGNAFNNIYIKDNMIIKEAKNEYGTSKIKKEIEFYKYLLNNSTYFPIPNIIHFSNNTYIMEYLSQSKPLYQIFAYMNIEEKNKILDTIYSCLFELHSATKIEIDKEIYTNNLLIECKHKLLSRKLEIDELIHKYKFIKKVNGIELITFNEALFKIQTFIDNYIKNQDKYFYSIIHGDCQFNNILYDVSNQKITFIDPRGYFGDTLLFGMPEYDLAKVKFALSGYDIFDNMDIKHLNIDNNNLTVDNIFLLDTPFDKNDISSILAISIWLANAHCFKNNELKAMFSYFYALYLATLYL